MLKLKKQLLAGVAACLLAMILWVVPASAATAAKEDPALNYDVYLKLSDIAGDVDAKGYEKWILLTGVEFDIANSSSSTGTGSGSGSGKASLKEFIVTKHTDSASVPIFLDAVTGKAIKTGQVVFLKHGDKATPFLTIELGDVHVTDYNFNNASEKVSLSFGSMEIKYVSQSKDGGKNPPITGSWNLNGGKK